MNKKNILVVANKQVNTYPTPMTSYVYDIILNWNKTNMN